MKETLSKLNIPGKKFLVGALYAIAIISPIISISLSDSDALRLASKILVIIFDLICLYLILFIVFKANTPENYKIIMILCLLAVVESLIVFV